MTVLKMDKPIQLIQITDTHLYGNPSGTLLKMNTHESFEKVLNTVKDREKSIDLILATGDIAQDGSEAAYKHFATDIEEELDAPFRWIPGNHDSAKVMSEVANGSDASDKAMRINNWQILMLDTSVEGQVYGMLAKDELAFLESKLQEAEINSSVDHSLVCLHHNPVKGNAGWMKDIGLRNKKAFWDLLKQSSTLRCVVYGHVHQELDYEHEGVRCLCTPSTCIQFKPNVVNFALDQVNPGYRTLSLYDDGSIDSEVHRVEVVEGVEFEADFSSGGY